jgi:hemerythrin-like domain-containing protein
MAKVGTPNVGADMVRIHRVITRGLSVSIERSESFAREGYPDAATGEGFLLYVQTLVSVLSAHHLAEDEVAFPYLRAKLPEVPFDQLMAEHRVMEEILEELKAIAEAVAAETQAGDSLHDLNRALTRLADLWHPHIQKEERFYDVEKMAALMDVDEHIRLGQALAEHSQQHLQPPSLGLPFVLYNMPADERATMTQRMPPALTQQLVPVDWKEQWAPMQPFLLD